MASKRSRGFAFTINNPDMEPQEIEQALGNYHYLIIGREHGEKENTLHYQCFVYYKNARTWSSLKKKIPMAHIEAIKGSPYQNFIYCSKEEFIEWGERPKGEGKRTDLDTIKDRLKNGDSLRDVILEEAKSLQQLKFAESLMKYLPRPKRNKPEVIWYHGDTGTGKTRLAVELLEDKYDDDWWMSSRNLKWWQGYYGQKGILIDDFRKDFCTFHELLRILDRYRYEVEVKGASFSLNAQTIIITSSYHPVEIYDTREDINQLLRRIDQTVYFGDENNTDTGVKGNTNALTNPEPPENEKTLINFLTHQKDIKGKKPAD